MTGIDDTVTESRVFAKKPIKIQSIQSIKYISNYRIFVRKVLKLNEKLIKKTVKICRHNKSYHSETK